jgi:hypothetical protein
MHFLCQNCMRCSMVLLFGSSSLLSLDFGESVGRQTGFWLGRDYAIKKQRSTARGDEELCPCKRFHSKRQDCTKIMHPQTMHQNKARASDWCRINILPVLKTVSRRRCLQAGGGKMIAGGVSSRSGGVLEGTTCATGATGAAADALRSASACRQ